MKALAARPAVVVRKWRRERWRVLMAGVLFYIVEGWRKRGRREDVAGSGGEGFMIGDL